MTTYDQSTGKMILVRGVNSWLAEVNNGTYPATISIKGGYLVICWDDKKNLPQKYMVNLGSLSNETLIALLMTSQELTHDQE